MEKNNQRPGRKKMPEENKVKMVSAYIQDKHKKAIVKKYGSLTEAVKTVIIPHL